MGVESRTKRIGGVFTEGTNSSGKEGKKEVRFIEIVDKAK